MTARLPTPALDTALALERVSSAWDEDILKQLTDYIRIPAKSPGFAPDWEQQGFIGTVVRNAAAWVEAQGRRPEAGSDSAAGPHTADLF